MGFGSADVHPDMASGPSEDLGEGIGLMEPLKIGENARSRVALSDLAVELAAKSTGLHRALPPGITTALAALVRSMNCYYSNLIEGHDTHPVEIERALKGDYSVDPRKRTLQLEAKAHISVQEWIDAGGLDGRALTVEGIREIHRRFCSALPDELSWVVDADERIRIVPGELRTRVVRVGRHIAVSPGAVPRFLRRFEEVHAKLGKTDSILAAATAHHRFLWIHPFLDGNGRVARLMSYSVLRDTLDTGGIWAVARGLARNVETYKNHLAACDLPRRNDLDGRGHLSEEALADFAAFFLTVCVDQVSFMESLVQPNRLRDRIARWAAEEISANRLPPHANRILEAVLYRGELPRGEIPILLGVGDRQARRITSALIDRGVLASDGLRAPLRPAFPATLAPHWMPGLFPDHSAGD